MRRYSYQVSLGQAASVLFARCQATTTSGPPPPAAPTIPPLDENNMEKYWTTRWSTNTTGWKLFEGSESKDGSSYQRDLFRTRLLEGSSAMIDLKRRIESKESSSESNQTRNRYGPQNPLRILVPLCGDSPILTYLISDEFQQDFAPEMAGVPIEVVGIDLLESAFASLFKEVESRAGWGSFTATRDVTGVQGTKQFQLARDVPCSSQTPFLTARRVLTLVAGDFFSVMEGPAAGPPPSEDRLPHLSSAFDVVWDRAAVVALPLNLRDRYTKTVETALTQKDNHACSHGRGPLPFPCKGMFLETARRPLKIRSSGPPFHVDEEPFAAPGSSDDTTFKLKYNRLRVSSELATSGHLLGAEAKMLDAVDGDRTRLPPWTFHQYVAVLKDQ